MRFENNNNSIKSNSNNYGGQYVTPKNYALNKNLWNNDEDSISYGDYKKLNNINSDLIGDTGRSMSDAYSPFVQQPENTQVKALSLMKEK